MSIFQYRYATPVGATRTSATATALRTFCNFNRFFDYLGKLIRNYARAAAPAGSEEAT